MFLRSDMGCVFLCAWGSGLYERLHTSADSCICLGYIGSTLHGLEVALLCVVAL